MQVLYYVIIARACLRLDDLLMARMGTYSLLNLKTAYTCLDFIYNHEPNHVVGGKQNR